MRQNFYNESSWISLGSFGSYTAEEKFTPLISSLHALGSYYSQQMTGYFKAPASTNYRFYMTCDDDCRLDFSETDMDPTATSTILNVGASSDYKEWD